MKKFVVRKSQRLKEFTDETYAQGSFALARLLREREIRALWEALEQSEQTVGYLITGNGAEETIERGGKTIVQVPAWKWLLDTA